MKYPLNVLFTSHYEHLRMGGQQSLLAIIQHLDRSKVQPFGLVTAEGDLSRALENSGCPTTVFELPDMRRGYLLKRWLPEAKHAFETVKKIRCLIEKHHIHILHADEESDAVMCGLAKKGTGAKVIYHGRVSAPHKLDALIAKHVDFIVGVSNAIRNRFQDKNISGKYQTIYDGADSTRFHPLEDNRALKQELCLPINRFILLFVGQIKEGKGILDLIDALALLKAKLNAEQMPLLVVAGVALRSDFQRMVEERVAVQHLSDDVKFIGQQSQIHRWMQCADAIVLPSHEGVEGLGRVLFEAMMCGAVGITTDISGTNEVVSRDIGFVVPQKNPSALAEAILTLIEKPDLKTALRAKSIVATTKRFDIRAHCRNIEQIYEQL